MRRTIPPYLSPLTSHPLRCPADVDALKLSDDFVLRSRPCRSRRRHRAQALDPAPVPLLDRARIARRHRRHRAGGERSGRTVFGRRDRRLRLFRPARRRCTPSSAPTAIPAARLEHRPRGPRSGSSPRRCCARCPRSRCSRCRSARCTWPTDADVVPALRMDAYTGGERPTGIPVGVYARRRPRVARSTSTPTSCSAPRRRTSTSPASRASPPRPARSSSSSRASSRPFPAHKGSVAALCFNVKGPDLCFLDQPAALTERRSRGSTPGSGLARRAVRSGRATSRPYKADGVNLNTLRTHPRRSPPTPSRWSGASARCSTTPRSCSTATTSTPRRTRSSISWPSGWSGASSRTDSLRGRAVPGARASPISRSSSAPSSTSWRRMAQGGEVWRTHHIATIRKVRNRLGNISTRAKGLVTDDGARQRPALGRLRGPQRVRGGRGRARPAGAGPGLRPRVSKLREHLERRDLGVDHVVVFVDELNKYAPADGPDTYVRKMLLDLSERGRYLGPGALLGPAVPLPGAAAGGGQRGHGASSAGWTRTSWPRRATPTLSPGHQDQAGHAAQGRADGPASALHPADLRPVSAARGARRAARGWSGSRPAPTCPSTRRWPGSSARWTPHHGRPGARAGGAAGAEDDVRRALARTRRTRPDDVLAFFTAAWAVGSSRRSPPGGPVRPLPSSADPYP